MGAPDVIDLTESNDPGVNSDAADDEAPRPKLKLGFMFWFSVVWISVLVIAAVFADWLPIRDPDDQGIITREVGRYEKPGGNAWFGGDSNGRDVFSNIIYGSRPSLILGAVVTLFAATVGTLLGVVSGFYRGRVDALIMGMVDTSLAFPGLILLVAVVGTAGNGLWVLVAVFAVLGVPAYARIVRGISLVIAEREFVEAARSMGATNWRIISREVLPLTVFPVLSFAFLGFAIVIATEGALAFLGLSVDQTTWGSLIAQGSRALEEAPHLGLIPAAVMFLTILSFNFVGDSLRLVIEPGSAATSRRDVGLAAAGVAGPDSLLSIRDLHTTLASPAGPVRAVDGVSLDVRAGTTLGIVGESGCGKTMLLRSILETFPLTDVTRTGTITYGDVDMMRAPVKARRKVLGEEVGVVFQDPLTALNPVRTVGTQIAEPMRVHRGLSKGEARTRSLELLEMVGIPEPERRLDEYPHQLSGGMRQRITIAIALANDPQLLLADEPTTALDVTVQDQILRLLRQLQTEHGMALVLVTHDLAVVRGWTDEVAVIYAGQIVETGPTDAIFASPKMRYTEALLRSMPRLDQPGHSVLATIEGTPPSLVDPPSGCRFAERCEHVTEQCRTEVPPLVEAGDGHRFACWNPVETSVDVVAGAVADGG